MPEAYPAGPPRSNPVSVTLPAAEVLVRMNLRTKGQRRAAVLAATVAMAAEIDAGEAQ
jgi:hypothetical protein